ncbi:MAG TPA: hypothetical protein VMM78_09745 [Thermomicrobiales bacterium]|nr:hypothetical protein [Thermomicrobiales bacterium]
MKFGRVEGLCVQIEGDDGPFVRVTVYIETDMGIDIVREIEVEPEALDGQPDLYWEADQWTQDTIANVLVPRGWELLGATDPPSRDPGEVPRSPRYALRTTMWVPPPGWDDDEG